MKKVSRFIPVLFLFVWLDAKPCFAALSEVQIKSAYVYNFIQFVEWPINAVKTNDKLKVCVIGDNELLTSLSTLNGRKAGEHELQVMRADSTAVWNTCHVLYIGEHEQRRFIPIIKSLGTAPVLTISDIPDFALRGGGIGLLYRNNKMQFEVNLASTRQAGLRLSSQMLNLAANVLGK